jgi:hypothetical protein
MDGRVAAADGGQKGRSGEHGSNRSRQVRRVLVDEHLNQLPVSTSFDPNI